jgi:hypothetical protein
LYYHLDKRDLRKALILFAIAGVSIGILKQYLPKRKTILIV